MKTKCVSCEAGTKFIHIIQIHSGLRELVNLSHSLTSKLGHLPCKVHNLLCNINRSWHINTWNIFLPHYEAGNSNAVHQTSFWKQFFWVTRCSDNFVVCLEVEATRSPETSALISLTTQRHIPDNHSCDACRRKSFWSYINALFTSRPLRFRYETLYKLKNAVFWNVASCGSCVNRRFGGKYRLYLQGK
jgi:hypothetical protein